MYNLNLLMRKHQINPTEEHSTKQLASNLCWGGGNFPPPLLVLLAGLIIKLTQDKLTEEKEIHTYRCPIDKGTKEVTKAGSFYTF